MPKSADSSPAQKGEKQEAAASDPTLRKKGKRGRDGAWSVRSQNPMSSKAPDPDAVKNIVHLRAAHKAKETSVLVNKENSNLTSPEVKKFTEACRNLPHDRPVAKVTQTTPGGTAWTIETPGGTTHTRIAKLGVFCVFSKEATGKLPAKPVTQVDITKADDAIEAVKENLHPIKYQTIIVTPELLAEARRENARLGGRREPSQNKVAANEGYKEKEASATRYANSFDEMPKEQIWEYLHLLPHFAVGNKKAQRMRNLGVGTDHANTEMLLLETQYPTLAKANPDGFKVEVEAHFIEETQLMKSIDYTITTKDKVLRFVFNPQLCECPDITVMNYLNTLVGVITEEKKTDDTGRLFKRRKLEPKSLNFNTPDDPKKFSP